MTAPAELHGVVKRYGAVTALDGVDLEIAEGERVALLGPNAAGKTTLVSILLGVRRPDAGVARLFGSDPRRPGARRRVGCTPQETTFPSTLRVAEIVDLVRAHFASPLPCASLLELVGLTPEERRQVGGLSGGQRRRLACALAFAGNPELVVMDEPSTGLDVEARLVLWEVIRHSGRTLLLTTHSFEEAQALAMRVIVLSRGRVVANGTPEQLTASAGSLEQAYLDATEVGA